MIAAQPLTLVKLMSSLPFSPANPSAGVQLQSTAEAKLAHVERPNTLTHTLKAAVSQKEAIPKDAVN